MHRLLILLLILLATGCSSVSMNKRMIVSPSKSLYYEADLSYSNKDFNRAIKLYNKFIDRSPKSDFITSAKLNLGMSYYYIEDYKTAYETLSDIDIKDANIKTFIDTVLETCKLNARDIIIEQELAKKEATKALDAPKGGHIRIKIKEAYLDTFGSVVVKGTTDKQATVTVDDAVAEPNENKKFELASSSWKKGRPVVITAKDADGNAGELKYYPDSEPPEEPDGLQAINTTSNSVEIEWNENPDEDGVKAYKMYYRLKGGGIFEVNDLIEDTKYEIVGLGALIEGANRTFEFYITAFDNMENESDKSDILEVTLP